jgi:hypothetical protein
VFYGSPYYGIRKKREERWIQKLFNFILATDVGKRESNSTTAYTLQLNQA